MNDAATVMNSPVPLKVGDEEYLLYPLNFDDHGAVQRWLDEQVRDPLEIVRQRIDAGGFSMEIQKYMVKAAIEVAARSRILIGTAEADALLDTIEGKAEMLYLSIRKGDPKFTYDRAMDLLRKMDQTAREAAAAAENVLRADSDPKAQASGGSMNLAATS
jgi:hypothetical protein